MVLARKMAPSATIGWAADGWVVGGWAAGGWVQARGGREAGRQAAGRLAAGQQAAGWRLAEGGSWAAGGWVAGCWGREALGGRLRLRNLTRLKGTRWRGGGRRLRGRPRLGQSVSPGAEAGRQARVGR